MFQSVAGVTYRVPDLQAAKQWYGQFLEGPPVLDSPMAVIYRIGESMLMLVPAAGAAAGDGRVVAYWNVADIDAAYKRLIEAGAKSETEITTTATRSRMARVTDPFGNSVGLVTPHKDGASSKTLEDRPSDSAAGVALARALAAAEEREDLRGPDTLAEVFLTADTRKSVRDPATRAWIRKKIQTDAPGSYEYFIARTAFLDEVVKRELEAGVPQLVFLGAGYDSRTYRFRELLGATRAFELDIETTQSRKRRALAEAGIALPPQLTFMAINFTKERIEDALGAAGYDAGKRALFVWEGVMYYLPAAAVDAAFESLRRCAPTGSRVAFDYLIGAPDMAERYGVKESRAIMKAMYHAEPVQYSIPEGTLEAFLGSRGFKLVQHLGTPELEQRYLAKHGRSLACFGLAVAEVKG